MGNVGSVNKSAQPRRRSDPPPQEPETPETNSGVGNDIHALNGHSRIDFEEYLSGEEKKIAKPLSSQSSPPRHQQSGEESIVLLDDDEPPIDRTPPKEMIDPLEEKEPASSNVEVRAVRTGPFTTFCYSSNIPYDDVPKRRELKQWIRWQLSEQAGKSFTVVFRRGVDDRIGIEFTPLNRFASDAPTRTKLLRNIIENVERRIAKPALAQTTPVNSMDAIFAKTHNLRNVRFVVLSNVPRGSSLWFAMVRLTQSIMMSIYDDPKSLHIKKINGYSLAMRGYKLPRFRKVLHRTIDTATLTAIMKELTKLQDQGYSIHNNLANDNEMLQRILDNVIEDLSSVLKIDLEKQSIVSLGIN